MLLPFLPLLLLPTLALSSTSKSVTVHYQPLNDNEVALAPLAIISFSANLTTASVTSFTPPACFPPPQQSSLIRIGILQGSQPLASLWGIGKGKGGDELGATVRLTSLAALACQEEDDREENENSNGGGAGRGVFRVYLNPSSSGSSSGDDAAASASLDTLDVWAVEFFVTPPPSSPLLLLPPASASSPTKDKSDKKGKNQKTTKKDKKALRLPAVEIVRLGPAAAAAVRGSPHTTTTTTAQVAPPRPVLNRPVLLGRDGKVPEVVPEKTLLQKYWWVGLAAVMVMVMGGGGGDGK